LVLALGSGLPKLIWIASIKKGSDNSYTGKQKALAEQGGKHDKNKGKYV